MIAASHHVTQVHKGLLSGLEKAKDLTFAIENVKVF